jgi:hypothetical protein
VKERGRENDIKRNKNKKVGSGFLLFTCGEVLTKLKTGRGVGVGV